MDRQPQLQALLESIPEVTNAYFQPPPEVQMVYPCIVYEWDEEELSHANNSPYMRERRYRLTIIDEDPTSTIPEFVGSLSKCSFSRFFRVKNLNHTVYKLYF